MTSGKKLTAILLAALMLLGMPAVWPGFESKAEAVSWSVPAGITSIGPLHPKVKMYGAVTAADGTKTYYEVYTGNAASQSELFYTVMLEMPSAAQLNVAYSGARYNVGDEIRVRLSFTGFADRSWKSYYAKVGAAAKKLWFNGSAFVEGTEADWQKYLQPIARRDDTTPTVSANVYAAGRLSDIKIFGCYGVELVKVATSDGFVRSMKFSGDCAKNSIYFTLDDDWTVQDLYVYDGCGGAANYVDENGNPQPFQMLAADKVSCDTNEGSYLNSMNYIMRQLGISFGQIKNGQVILTDEYFIHRYTAGKQGAVLSDAFIDNCYRVNRQKYTTRVSPSSSYIDLSGYLFHGARGRHSAYITTDAMGRTTDIYTLDANDSKTTVTPPIKEGMIAQRITAKLYGWQPSGTDGEGKLVYALTELPINAKVGATFKTWNNTNEKSGFAAWCASKGQAVADDWNCLYVQDSAGSYAKATEADAGIQDLRSLVKYANRAISDTDTPAVKTDRSILDKDGKTFYQYAGNTDAFYYGNIYHAEESYKIPELHRMTSADTVENDWQEGDYLNSAKYLLSLLGCSYADVKSGSMKMSPYILLQKFGLRIDVTDTAPKAPPSSDDGGSDAPDDYEVPEVVTGKPDEDGKGVTVTIDNVEINIRPGSGKGGKITARVRTIERFSDYVTEALNYLRERIHGGAAEFIAAYDIDVSGLEDGESTELDFRFGHEWANKTVRICHRLKNGKIKEHRCVLDAEGKGTITEDSFSPFIVFHDDSVVAAVPATGGAPYMGMLCLAAVSVCALALARRKRRSGDA
ncbi:MAG: hypothetical protein Q4E65_00830 [Clostridia bacterium]|nr:hypothetical protein [Clostridia bacterium]